MFKTLNRITSTSFFLHYSSNCLPETLRIFKTGSKFDRDPQFYDKPPQEGGFVQEPKREVALPRRAMLASSLTRDSVRRAESRLLHHVSKFLEKLAQYSRSSEPVNLTKGFMCLTADGVMEYVYQKPFEALDAKDFESEILVPVTDFVSTLQWNAYFPRLFGNVFKVIDKLPDWVFKAGLKSVLTQKACLQVSSNNLLSPWHIHCNSVHK